MIAFYPETGTAEEWNAAYYRLEDYFRAHRVTNKVHQSQLILDLLQRAAARHALAPTEASPTRLALEEAYAEMDRWFQPLVSNPELPPHRASIMGRVSMQILDAPSRWPYAFLAPEREIPADFRMALKMSSVQSGPDLAVSRMVPRPLDVGPASESMEESWERLGHFSLALLVGLISLFAVAGFLYLSK